MNEEEFSPVVIKKVNKEDVEMVHIFSITDGKGKAKKYYAPKKMPFNVTLRATKIFSTHGEAQAQAFVMTQFLGEEAYVALCNCEDITEEEFEAIAQYANKVVMGPGKAPSQGNRASRRGKRK